MDIVYMGETEQELIDKLGIDIYSQTVLDRKYVRSVPPKGRILVKDKGYYSRWVSQLRCWYGYDIVKEFEG